MLAIFAAVDRNGAVSAAGQPPRMPQNDVSSLGFLELIDKRPAIHAHNAHPLARSKPVMMLAHGVNLADVGTTRMVAHLIRLSCRFLDVKVNFEGSIDSAFWHAWQIINFTVMVDANKPDGQGPAV